MSSSNINNDKGPDMKMPKFNMNWIYLLMMVVLGVLYFTSGNVNSSVKTQASYTQFKTMVLKGYAKSIVVNNETNTLQMYVKPEHIRDVFKQGVDQTGKEPSVTVEYGSVDQVEAFVNEARQLKKFNGDFSYENKRDNDFFSMSGSDFVEMFVGVGASRVRDLFRQAKEKSPCIIFIDEIDAVGRARSKNPAMGGNDERENTLNALLTEMDGFGTNSGVIILAATNRADMLDSALMRAGRFDRQIHVDLPDLNERKAIFQVHLKPVKTDDTLDVDFLARQTPGFSGADIANVCNEAALIAARHNCKTVGKQDFLDAVDRIIGGLEKKTKIMTDAEKKAIAIHEAGHATISWFCEHANPLVKVSIVPRGRALGAAWYLPEERAITTKEEMLDEMCATLGGRAAEELFIGRISTGAMNDLERVTKSAYGMVAYAGMSEKLPNICYYNNNEYSFQRPYSETTAKIMDDEVLKMINTQYERAKQILEEHKEGHAQLADILVQREVIFADDVEKIFGKRPWASRSEELLEAQRKAEAEAMAEQREKELEAQGTSLEQKVKEDKESKES